MNGQGFSATGGTDFKRAVFKRRSFAREIGPVKLPADRTIGKFGASDIQRPREIIVFSRLIVAGRNRWLNLQAGRMIGGHLLLRLLDGLLQFPFESRNNDGPRADSEYYNSITNEIRPAVTMPFPLSDGSRRILDLAMCPQIIPGSQPTQMTSDDNEQTSEATANLEVRPAVAAGTAALGAAAAGGCEVSCGTIMGALQVGQAICLPA